MTPEQLRALLDYDAETGKLFWRQRGPEYGPKFRWFNTRYAGKEAMTAQKDSGHRGGPLGGRTLLAHRVAWAIHYGEWPSGNIDHINGDRADNRIKNLRIATPAENARNRRPNKGKRSGLPHGVSARMNAGGIRYFAQIQFNRKTRHLGYFSTPEDAEAAYLAAKAALPFHANHGRAMKERGDV